MCLCYKTEQRMKQFESYINEKEAKRKRAITRYQLELKIKLQKKLEHDILQTQLSEIKTMYVTNYTYTSTFLLYLYGFIY